MDKPEDLHYDNNSEDNAGSQPAKMESASGEQNAAASELPVVRSPQLGGDSHSEEPAASVHEQAKNRSVGALPILFNDRTDEAASEPEAATSTTHRRSLRFALLAATIAAAAGIGALVGSLSASGIGHETLSAVAVPGSSNKDDVVAALKVQLAELTALKGSLETATRNADAYLAKISDRLSNLEHAQVDPAAKLAHIADAVDRLEKRMGTADITGSIGAKPPAANVGVPVLHDWMVTNVRNGRAMVESRYGALFLATPGGVMPGLGRIQEVKRQNGEWIVVTDKGIITQHP